MIRTVVRPGGPYRGWMLRRAGLLAVAGLLVLTACDGSPAPDQQDQGAAPPSSTAAPRTAPSASPTSEPVTPAPPPADCTGGDVVAVTDADSLRQALDDAAPGQVIQLADGRYEGNFVTTVRATADAPIRLCGSRNAVLDGGDIDGDYTLHLSGAAYWQVVGFTVTGGQKGVMVDAGVGNRIEGLLVTSMGDEAIHLRSHSTDNIVVGNTIRDTGLRKPKFGEGVYIGSAENNWCQLTECQPDRSDRNIIEGNDIADTTAESVDIKEGTTGGTVTGNTFDGTDITGADSWVDVKGNNWTISGNTGQSSPADGFQTHSVYAGWGRGNTFTGNIARVDGPGYGIHLAPVEDNRVACDNQATGAAEGLSNVPCK
jgi:hypothetical protein